MDAKKFARFLRKIISEEVRIVVREEMTLMKEQLLEEQIQYKPTVLREQIVKKDSPIKSSKLKQVESLFKKSNQPIVYQKTGDPIKDLLEETRLTGDFSQGQFGVFSQEGPQVSGIPQMMPQNTQVVESVQDMIANAEPAFQPEFAKVDTVPDFSQMMSKLGLGK